MWSPTAWLISLLSGWVIRPIWGDKPTFCILKGGSISISKRLNFSFPEDKKKKALSGYLTVHFLIG